jgi:hypothetical protein
MMQPVFFAHVLNQIEELYVALVKTGEPPKPHSVRQIGQRKLVQSLPRHTIDRLMYPNFKGEVWLEAGKDVAQRAPPKQPRLAGVLAAGNGEVPMDALSWLFMENCVVVWKLNPVNAEGILGHVDKILRPLIKAGFLEIVSGGAAEATVQHQQ